MNKRILYLDWLRVVAAVAVVLVHAAVADTGELSANNFLAVSFWRSLAGFAVPIFVMISGAMMLDPERKVSVKKCWQKIGKLAIVWVVWCVIYAGLTYFQKGKDAAVHDLIFGHYHMWYLPMAAGLYALTPMLRKVAESGKVLRYAVILFVAAVTLNLVLPDFALSMMVGYAGYYLLGYYLKSTEFKGRWIYVLGAIMPILITAITVAVTEATGEVYLGLRSDFTPMMLILSVAVFLGAKKIFSDSGKESWAKKKNLAKVVTEMASCSLGVYLIHIIILVGLARVGLNNLSFGTAWIGTIVTTVATYGISLGIVFVARKITKKLPFQVI